MITLSSKFLYWMEIGDLRFLLFLMVWKDYPVICSLIIGIRCVYFTVFVVYAFWCFYSRCSLFTVYLLETDCVLLLFLTSLIIFLAFHSFLSSAISPFVLSVTLCVHICISFSFCVVSTKAASLFLTELT